MDSTSQMIEAIHAALDNGMSADEIHDLVEMVTIERDEEG